MKPLFTSRTLRTLPLILLIALIGIAGWGVGARGQDSFVVRSGEFGEMTFAQWWDKEGSGMPSANRAFAQQVWLAAQANHTGIIQVHTGESRTLKWNPLSSEEVRNETADGGVILTVQPKPN